MTQAPKVEPSYVSRLASLSEYVHKEFLPFTLLCKGFLCTFSELALPVTMWSTFARYCTILIALGSFTSASAIPNTETNTSPETLLADFAIKPPGPLVVGNPAFTCEVFQTLFPKNETFSSQSAFYTPLYEIPWYGNITP